MGLDDMLKDQIRQRAPELKRRLVQEFDELTDKDMEDASDDPDDIVDRIQKKTGQPREQVEQRVKQTMQG
jgi:phage regulator Rha-like protein